MTARIFLLSTFYLLCATPAYAQDAAAEPSKEEDHAHEEGHAHNDVAAPPAHEATAQPEPPSAPAPTLDLPDTALNPIEATAPSTDEGELTLDDWNDATWTLKKPEVSLLELHGYFRGRFDMLRNLDLGNAAAWEQNQRYTAESGDAGDRQANYTGANMRLRLQPVLNITEGISAHMTIDVFDNLIMGSTPAFTTSAAGTPNTILSSGQRLPIRGRNALNDSLVVRRAYVDMKLLNEQVQLKFGRMPDHWGLGMVANSGDCLDCNYGTIADRAALTAKFGGHLFTAMFDWVSSGPSVLPFGAGQPLDAVTWDNGRQYSLRIQRYQTQRQQKDALAHGRHVLNYGVWGALRQQPRSLNSTYYLNAQGEPIYGATTPIDANTQEERYATNIMHGSVYGQYMSGALSVSIEAAGIYGKFKDRAIFRAGDAQEGLPPIQETEINMWGAALEASYDMTENLKGMTLSLKSGIASGDAAPGFGALNQADTQRGYFGSQGRLDKKLNNFQFNPDYQVDLLMYRNLIGTVTDSFYVRPEFDYAFAELIHLKVAASYNQALTVASTASSCVNINCNEGVKGAKPLGIEADGELSYGMPFDSALSPGSLRGAVQGAVFIPVFGNNNGFRNNDSSVASADASASLAWTVQFRLYITF